MLKQSIDKEEDQKTKTVKRVQTFKKKSYGYDSDESDDEVTRTMSSVARAVNVLNTEKKQLPGKLRKGQTSEDLRSRRRS